MRKTLKKNSQKGTRKNKFKEGATLKTFQKEITVVFLEMLLMVKLATDELYTKLNANIDSFIEILLGKTGVRSDLTNKKNIRLIDLNSTDSLKREVEAFKGYLVSLNSNQSMKTMSNTDLFNIRDTILGDMNQFLYLLSFK